MTHPKNDTQALRRYGVELLPFIAHWRARLVKGCSNDDFLTALVQPLQSDLLETQVFFDVCRSLEEFLQQRIPLTVELISRHTLLLITAALCRRGWAEQVERLVDKLCPT